jgi:hypothetical protein
MHDDGRTLLDVGAGNYLTDIATLLRRHCGKTAEELKTEGN